MRVCQLCGYGNVLLLTGHYLSLVLADGKRQIKCFPFWLYLVTKSACGDVQICWEVVEFTILLGSRFISKFGHHSESIA